MIVFYGYAAFCITVALCIVVEIYHPLLKKAINDGIINDLTSSPWLGMFVTFLINLAFAPVMFFALVLPNCFSALERGFDKIIREVHKP